MSPTDFLDLSLGVQTALGGGYLAYVTAYAGLRRHHAGQDSIFITLAFGIVASLAFQWAAPRGDMRAAAAGVFLAVLAGVGWRWVGRALWQGAMAAYRVHRDDGLHAGWDALIQTHLGMGQISVQLRDGRILYCNDTRPFDAEFLGGLYLGGDGSVVMVVEEEEMEDGRVEAREGVVDSEWGARLTYIPASEIERVNLRVERSTSLAEAFRRWWASRRGRQRQATDARSAPGARG